MNKLCVFFYLFYSLEIFAQTTYAAHRGASYDAPENTLASIQLAWQWNSHAAECDILLTKDNQIILCHDKNTKRILGKEMKVKNTVYKDLEEYPVKLHVRHDSIYKNERIPLLKDILPTIPDSGTLVIELKCGQEILPHLKLVLDEYWKKGKIAFLSFSYPTIMAAKKTFPNIPCYFLAHFKMDIQRRIQKLLNGPLDGIDLNHNIVDEKIVSQFKNVGKETWCYTVNDPKIAHKMKRCGVSCITTDRPKWLKEEVENN